MRVNAHLDVRLVRRVLGVLSPSRGEGVQPALYSVGTVNDVQRQRCKLRQCADSNCWEEAIKCN